MGAMVAEDGLESLLILSIYSGDLFSQFKIEAGVNPLEGNNIP